MKAITWTILAGVGVLAFVAGRAAMSADAPPAPVSIAQAPLFVQATRPPLNMLVMGKDHKIYYEAYNDASDLDGDGILDVGYRPSRIDYYGYYNSNVCYVYEAGNGGRFIPSSPASNKQCSGKWSGDFLNYLTTSRMDALRRVLYGGWRQVDTAGDTTLQGAFFPQDGHSWGKEYKSTADSGYNISQYAPLSQPAAGKYHLFAVTTFSGNDATFASGYTAPVFRVQQNSSHRIWNWLSIEGPVAGNKCFTAGNTRVDCVTGAGTGSVAWDVVPAAAYQNLSITTWDRKNGSGSPGNESAMDTLFSDNARNNNLCGSGAIARIDAVGSDINPFVPGGKKCTHDNYLTMIQGDLVIPTGGNYRFAIDGDDAVDLMINGNVVVGWYGGHGSNRSEDGLNSHSVTVSLAAGTHKVRFRHQEATGGAAWGLFWQPPAGASSIVNYNVRVQACTGTASLRDDSCKAYPGGNFKPTGILHDYGEGQKMYFGLITGSQFNNLEGGVLRKNISNFAEEINPDDGTFKPGLGIANTLSRLRMIGGGYAGGASSNFELDKNWNWALGTGRCPSVGDRAIVNGECRMWGNPIAEMMFEGMRYFAGASAATALFATGGAAEGHAEETTMGLSQDTWKDPYAGKDGYPSCSRPFQTVISDINPSYDADLPGSAFSAVSSDASVAGFSASGQGSTIWNHEFGAGARNVFIGDVAGMTDGAPTAKSASSFGNIRGLSPEEPTKGGTYYAASVARYGYVNDLNPNAPGNQKLGVYAIALASPLPQIEFSVGERLVTILPFAKTASGTFGLGAQKPTNTIVDFYVERIANLDPALPVDASVNGGRPYAEFRISYEDVEQGNDHDMDAIAKYTIRVNAAGTLTVQVDSEYAAGSANQNMGYVLSGTTKDGIYLVVRDSDSNAATFLPYDFNTPPGVEPGGCRNVTTGGCGQQLPLTSARTFVPSSTAPTATELKNPLWYAAKYGGFKDTNGNNLPDPGEWDSNVPGKPDNYFLVTNPLQLRAQLTQAFDAIQSQADQSTGALTVNGARLGAASFTVAPSFSVLREGSDWVGELKGYQISRTGNAGALLWNAGDKIGRTTAAADSRKVFTAVGPVQASNRTVNVKRFQADQFGTTTSEQFQTLGYSLANITNIYGSGRTPNDLVRYLRGDASLEGGTKGSLPFRKRSSALGDIINSTPQVSTAKDNFGWAAAPGLTSSVRKAYTTFLGNSGKGGRANYVYVGANDGMLHAFDASIQPCATLGGGVCATATSGDEVFAYVPNSVLGKTGLLADPDYLHRYYVDGSISVADSYDGSTWRTLLAGASGAGGKGVFGLDVTDPSTFDATKVLWEVNASTVEHGDDIGHVMGVPVLVPLDDGRWVTLFGNGYNSRNGKAALFVVDAFSGVVLEKLVVSDGVAGMNGLGQIAAIDTDADGLVDSVYGADLHGNIWRFEFGKKAPFTATVSFGGSPLFVSRAPDGSRQPITSGLEVSAGPGGGAIVFFGTGSYFLESDHSTASGQQVQSLYGIWDNGTPIVGARGSILQTQSITSETLGSPNTRTSSQNTVNYSTQRGWVIDLVVGNAAVGERFIGAPRLQNGKVFFTTFVPLGDPCIPGGRNWLFSLDALTGAASMSGVSLDASGKPPVCTGADCAAIGIADGAPVRDTSVIIPPMSPLPGLAGGCIPGTPGCAAPATPEDAYQRCTLIIRAAGAPPLYLPRPCGRQSWRQVR